MKIIYQKPDQLPGGVCGKGQGRRGRPSGYKMSKESKQAISESRTGQAHSDEVKKRIAESVADSWTDTRRAEYKEIASKDYIITYPDGHEEHIRCLLDFCESSGLAYSMMQETKRGKIDNYKGYSVRLADE